LVTQLRTIERSKAIDLALNRSCVFPSHSYAAGTAGVFTLGFDLPVFTAGTR
jgi:hypothetical protein